MGNLKRKEVALEIAQPSQKQPKLDSASYETMEPRVVINPSQVTEARKSLLVPGPDRPIVSSQVAGSADLIPPPKKVESQSSGTASYQTLQPSKQASVPLTMGKPLNATVSESFHPPQPVDEDIQLISQTAAPQVGTRRERQKSNILLTATSADVDNAIQLIKLSSALHRLKKEASKSSDTVQNSNQKSGPSTVETNYSFKTSKRDKDAQSIEHKKQLKDQLTETRPVLPTSNDAPSQTQTLSSNNDTQSLKSNQDWEDGFVEGLYYSQHQESPFLSRHEDILNPITPLWIQGFKAGQTYGESKPKKST
jgi:hypothetical protein